MNLAEHFKAQPNDRAALIVHERVTTYGELAVRVNRWRGGMIAAGLLPGDRVAILAGNTEIFVVAYLAALTGGLVAVPVNPRAPGPAVQRELEQVQPRAIVVGEAGRRAWTAVSEVGVKGLAYEFVADGSTMPGLDEAEPSPVVSVDDDHPAVLLFTSGTSGTSKPAVLTHGNLWASLSSLSQLPDVDLSDHHRVLAIIPLFHVFGLNVIINLGLLVGATVVLEDHVAPRRTAQLIATHGISMVLGPPNMWSAFLRDEDLTAEDFASVVFAVSGAAKLDPTVWTRLHEQLGVDVREGYGLTETCATVASAAGVPCPPGSVGVPMPGVEVRLVDEAGADVLVGDPGELLVRGPMVSSGYWTPDGLDSGSLDTDGWLHTGDLAFVDESGHLSIVDRIKDLIIVSGFNVHPAEVEQILAQHPSVEAVAVVGEPSADQGERIVAHVVPRPDMIVDPLALQEFAASQLARYKVPRRIVIAESLPTGAIGKVLRRELSSTDG